MVHDREITVAELIGHGPAIRAFHTAVCVNRAFNPIIRLMTIVLAKLAPVFDSGDPEDGSRFSSLRLALSGFRGVFHSRDACAFESELTRDLGVHTDVQNQFDNDATKQIYERATVAFSVAETHLVTFSCVVAGFKNTCPDTDAAIAKFVDESFRRREELRHSLNAATREEVRVFENLIRFDMHPTLRVCTRLGGDGLLDEYETWMLVRP